MPPRGSIGMANGVESYIEIVKKPSLQHQLRPLFILGFALNPAFPTDKLLALSCAHAHVCGRSGHNTQRDHAPSQRHDQTWSGVVC